jgi:hypothetical protein
MTEAEVKNGPDISVRLGRLHLNNPVMLASGTSGYGEEYARFIDLNQIGGIIVKGTSLHPKLGNPPARVFETAGGMLNSIAKCGGREVYQREDALPERIGYEGDCQYLR